MIALKPRACSYTVAYIQKRFIFLFVLNYKMLDECINFIIHIENLSERFEEVDFPKGDLSTFVNKFCETDEDCNFFVSAEILIDLFANHNNLNRSKGTGFTGFFFVSATGGLRKQKEVFFKFREISIEVAGRDFVLQISPHLIF